MGSGRTSKAPEPATNIDDFGNLIADPRTAKVYYRESLNKPDGNQYERKVLYEYSGLFCVNISDKKKPKVQIEGPAI